MSYSKIHLIQLSELSHVLVVLTGTQQKIQTLRDPVFFSQHKVFFFSTQIWGDGANETDLTSVPVNELYKQGLRDFHLLGSRLGLPDGFVNSASRGTAHSSVPTSTAFADRTPRRRPS